jgi:hypothetical protein
MSHSCLAARILIPSLLFTGCSSLCSCDAFQKLEKGEQTKTVQNAKVGKLIVVAHNGFIRVNQGSSNTIQIHAVVKARTKERLEGVQIHAAPNKNGNFEIFASFPLKRYGNESCSFTIQVPQTKALDLKTSNGSIFLNKLEGPARLRSSNGTLEVFDHQGSLQLTTSNGSIRIRDASNSVKAHTSNGKVDVVLREDNPGPVEIQTSNGSIRLKVGQAFEGTLRARTGNGSVKADLPNEIQMKRKKRKEMTLYFSKKGQASSLASSNGSIWVGHR